MYKMSVNKSIIWSGQSACLQIQHSSAPCQYINALNRNYVLVKRFERFNSGGGEGYNQELIMSKLNLAKKLYLNYLHFSTF